MIDLHSHILPGIDDGSPDVQTTAAILEEMAKQGTEYVVATPHFYARRDEPEEFLARREAALQSLQRQAGEKPHILVGAEIAFFDSLGRSDVPEKLQIGNTGLALIEMPFKPWTTSMVRQICELQLQTGITPVLAHVERYRGAQQMKKYKEELLQSGVLFQCNAEAFLRWNSRGWALKLLRQGKLHFLGTDTHNLTTRKPNLPAAVAVIEKKLGAEAVEYLLDFSAAMLKL